MKKADQHAGFTLLEILVVMSIIGILTGALSMSYMRNLRVQRLNEAAATVYAELSRARGLSQRQSIDQPITWTTTTLSAGAGRSVALPNGTKFVTLPATGLTYTAPHGELEMPGSVDGWRLEIVDATGTLHTAVDAVGVTGKVIRRNIVPLATALP